MRKAIQLYIIGLIGTLISIALSISCLHLPQGFGFLLLSNPSQILMLLSATFFIEGVLFSGFGYIEDKHEVWLNRCAHALAPYEELLFEAAGAQTAEKTRRQA